MLASVAYVAKEATFVVDAAEEAFVLRNDDVVRRYTAGLGYKVPLLEREVYILSLQVRRKTGRLDGLLAGGVNCVVDADIIYRITDAERALRWRLSEGLSVAKETSNPEQRNDYVEPERVFAEALLQSMSNITPAQAKVGAVEAWISNFSRSDDNDVNADGTQIVNVKASDITCSDKTPAPVCNTVYEEAPKVFAGPSRFVFSQGKDASIVVALEDLSLVLKGQTRVLVGGAAYGFSIADQDTFYKAVRTQKNAASRLHAMLNDSLRQSLVGVDLQSLNGFSFSQTVPEKTRKNFERIGVELVYVEAANAYYRVGETICED